MTAPRDRSPNLWRRLTVGCVLLLSFPSVICRKYCSGTFDGASMSGEGLKDPIRRLRALYSNCSIVNGNLEVVGITPENSNETGISAFDFLSGITEVYGYVYISKIDVPEIPFPSLKIIWNRQGGFFPTAENFRDPTHPQYGQGLVIENNPGLKILAMPKLRVVHKGGVFIRYNPLACHLHSINWTHIVGTQGNFYIQDPNEECRRDKCAISCNGNCWGPGDDECQNLYRADCAPQCGGTCYNKNSPRDCCHHYCVGGCSGPTNRECFACGEFENEGSCVEDCPSLEKYDQHKTKYVPNPDGRYKYGKVCVEKCPENMLIDREACVSSCPEGYHVPFDKLQTEKGPHECVKCEKACDKRCVITDVVTCMNIDDFINCTVVQGKIDINEQTFTKPFKPAKNCSGGNRALTATDLEKMSAVQQVTNYVILQSDTLRSFSFLRNLETILGRHKDQYALEISGNDNLVELGLKSLKQIKGTAFIGKNPNLCYGRDIPWSNISTTAKTSYRGRKICVREETECSEECAPETGCWGKGPDMCFACRSWKLNGSCVSDCPRENHFRIGSELCERCHPECVQCSDTTHLNCSKCAHVRLDGACISECPKTHFEQGGICIQCHAACLQFGCTGDSDTLGRGGCNKCLHALIGSDGEVKRCLKDEMNENQLCELGYFKRRVSETETVLKSKVSSNVCEKCHPACKTCQAYGTKISSRSDACKCMHYKRLSRNRDEECSVTCDMGYYIASNSTQNSSGICSQCDEQCSRAGCSGSGPDRCNDCETFKHYHDKADPQRFICVSACPDSERFVVDSVCTSENPEFAKAVQKRKTTVLIGTIVGGFLLLLVAVSLICFCQKRRNSQALKNLMLPPQLPFDAALNSNAKPNMARLRIIKETELRKGGMIGQGAFGSVYRGVFNPDDTHPPMKIPVAIKIVARSSSSDTTEMLEEASLMAAMDHRHLVRLVGVCVSDDIQLLTPLMPLGNLLDYVQNNKANIGSFALLTWATQIAEGMEYLEANHLVHRDLAARNVLVQMPYHVRVADFGLAKMLDPDQKEVHVEGRVPLKWLAIESIEKHIFTHKSDVWAFGVTLWELLKFGAKPYPDVRMDEVFLKIQSGQRLPQPEICSVDLYLILIRCWLLNADSRPNFKQLREILEGMLKDPPKYLSVPNDKLLRIPSVASQDEHAQLDRWRNEFSVEGDVSLDYLDGSSSPASPRKPLIAVASRASPRNTSVGSRRYQKDPTERKNLPPHDEEGASKNFDDSRVLPTDVENYLIPDSQQGRGPSSSRAPDNSTYTPVVTGLPSNKGEASYYNNSAGASGVENLEYLQPNSRRSPELDLDTVVETETCI